MINSKILNEFENDYSCYWNNYFISVPGLLEGENVIMVRFSCDYAIDGNGLHSFIDVDKK